MDGNNSAGRGRYRSAFDLFLRTGIRFRHAAGEDVEVKFNPWHDPDDGRFTFAGQGNRYGSDGGGGPAGDQRQSTTPARSISGNGKQDGASERNPPNVGGSFGGGGATGDGYWLNSKEVAELQRKNPGTNPTMVGAGDTWDTIAKRTGTSRTALLAANGKSAATVLKAGGVVLVPVAPTQSTEGLLRGDRTASNATPSTAERQEANFKLSLKTDTIFKSITIKERSG